MMLNWQEDILITVKMIQRLNLECTQECMMTSSSLQWNNDDIIMHLWCTLYYVFSV